MRPYMQRQPREQYFFSCGPGPPGNPTGHCWPVSERTMNVFLHTFSWHASWVLLTTTVDVAPWKTTSCDNPHPHKTRKEKEKGVCQESTWLCKTGKVSGLLVCWFDICVGAWPWATCASKTLWHFHSVLAAPVTNNVIFRHQGAFWGHWYPLPNQESLGSNLASGSDG